MAIIRWILGRLILLIDALTTPKGVNRPADEQKKLDADTAQLALYQFKACPFCVKVRRFMKQHTLHIETRDAKGNQLFKEELLKGGGEIKVPCLRIENEQGAVQWMYESSEIMRYLEQRYLLPQA